MAEAEAIGCFEKRDIHEHHKVTMLQEQAATQQQVENGEVKYGWQQELRKSSVSPLQRPAWLASKNYVPRQ